MRRDELEELHYITPISNVASILAHGILSQRTGFYHTAAQRHCTPVRSQWPRSRTEGDW